MLNDLGTIVNDLVQASPPGELKDVKNSLSAIIQEENQSVINNSISTYIVTKGLAVDDQFIVSSYNKDPNSSKFIDFIEKKKFNLDLVTQSAIDLEEYTPDVEYPVYFDRLVESLIVYGKDHYPSDLTFTIVPDSKGGMKVLLIGEKLSQANFYTGRWSSIYSLDKDGEFQGKISLDIHYYEDGNVRLEFEETTESVKLDDVCASSIMNYIRDSEYKATLKLMDDFTLLNQKYFKNLRRLLPVTKSKINWGKAIGNYRLGSQVVNTK